MALKPNSTHNQRLRLKTKTDSKSSGLFKVLLQTKPRPMESDEMALLCEIHLIYLSSKLQIVNQVKNLWIAPRNNKMIGKFELNSFMSLGNKLKFAVSPA